MTYDMWIVLGLFVLAMVVAFISPINRAILRATFRHPRERTVIKAAGKDVYVEHEPAPHASTRP